MSNCERSYYAASANHDIARSDGGQPLMLRYIAADHARSQWIDVAAECTNRMAEGVIRSAQNDRIAGQVAQRLGFDDDVYIYGTNGSGTAATKASGDANVTADLRAVTLAGIDNLNVSSGVLAKMALAEDRAGFATEVLAARGSSEATLALADAHKTTGERLISLARSGASQSDTQSDTSSSNGSAQSSAIADPRQKVYDVSQLIANVGTTTDPATGLTAPTYAVVEINCAREELTAIAQSTSQSGTGQSSAHPASNQPTTQSQPVAQPHTSQTTGNRPTARPQSAAEADADSDHDASMRIIADLIASRVAQALAAGYPSFDHALFTE
ncbi:MULTISPECIES: hypothetical protein [Bifidobacterium]|uniref:hypothetical protein n=1 Tax=Bifidobacterium TaxID=1678 RepID=UPI001BDD8877|nr:MULTISPECIES: hypothetical protein [Bifidobacterium]MBT1160494.1 hypothetical protein [Bifidobacterium sp. SO1]MBW3078635.1 hypothetical protein [Bifidobacterium simiiventris]